MFFWNLGWRAYEKTAQNSPLSVCPRTWGGVQKPAFLGILMPMLLVQGPPLPAPLLSASADCAFLPPVPWGWVFFSICLAFWTVSMEKNDKCSSKTWNLVCQGDLCLLGQRELKMGQVGEECSNHHTIALFSHASKVMLEILQARLQLYVNHELPDVQPGCFC